MICDRCKGRNDVKAVNVVKGEPRVITSMLTGEEIGRKDNAVAQLLCESCRNIVGGVYDVQIADKQPEVEASDEDAGNEAVEAANRNRMAAVGGVRTGETIRQVGPELRAPASRPEGSELAGAPEARGRNR